MKQAYVKGTDIRIIGTLERIPGRAEIAGFKDSLTDIEWAGGTEVFWDDMKSETRKGSLVYLDEDGAEHLADELELRDE